jgi:hypothetical protein
MRRRLKKNLTFIVIRRERRFSLSYSR